MCTEKGGMSWWRIIAYPKVVERVGGESVCTEKG